MTAKYNVLLVGSGGREHALAWKLSQSPLLGELWCAPGSDGIDPLAQTTGIDIHDHEAIISFCRQNAIDLVVVGPEAPLAAGLCDQLEAAHIGCFGPSAPAAQLESSKQFTKRLCDQFNIPTASWAIFDNGEDALAHLEHQTFPIVIKADGLAAGKGVVIAEALATAQSAIKACFSGEFGSAGASVVIEEFLEGEEASLFALCDGMNTILLGTAQDHKRAFDGETGPNTGGMGAYSPASILTQPLIDEIFSDIIMPTVAGMHYAGTPFVGILYAGLMITDTGPKLIEYNVRFGDPECQVLMLRLQSDLLALMIAACEGSLLDHPLLDDEIQWLEDTALCVVAASKGYPGPYKKNSPINGLDRVAQSEGIELFHAGTFRDEGQWRANGGRVLNVCSVGKTVSSAQENVYKALKKLDWPNGYYRTDIGWRAIEREKS